MAYSVTQLLSIFNKADKVFKIKDTNTQLLAQGLQIIKNKTNNFTAPNISEQKENIANILKNANVNTSDWLRNKGSTTRSEYDAANWLAEEIVKLHPDTAGGSSNSNANADKEKKMKLMKMKAKALILIMEMEKENLKTNNK